MEMRFHAQLEQPYPNAMLATINVALDGKLIGLWSAGDLAQRTPDGCYAFSRTRQPVAATVTVYEGSQIANAIELPELQLNFPSVQLSNDELWVIGGRCRYHNGPEDNAELYNLDGKLVRKGCLGDCINWVRQTPAGNLWVGYGDEGVFGNKGWGLQPGGGGYIEPLGANGIVLWDNNFTKIYEPDCGGDICDAYAGTLVGEDLWASTYVDFPIRHFTTNSSVAFPTSDSGVRALITNQQLVATIGEYGYPLSYRVWDITRVPNHATFITGGELSLPRSYRTPLAEKLRPNLLGFGQELNMLIDQNWFKIDISQLAPRPLRSALL